MQPKLLTLLVVVLLMAVGGAAQSFVLDLPDQSQRASVSQRVGLTTVIINYHRPLVKGRKVFGGIVPYGEVWRAGANTNTTIEFTHDVQVEGQPLAKGVYGLHTIPNPDSWTVIFSKQAEAWGSYTYDQKEDALRVTVKPQASDMHEALTYTIDPVGRDTAVVKLAWDKTAVPFTIKVDVDGITRASLKTQLRGLAQYTWLAWQDAADYLLENKVALDEALEYANRSIQTEERYENLSTKANILKALGRNDEAVATIKQALAKASPIQMHNYARQLQTEGKSAEAFEVFKTNAQKNPNFWVARVGMARVHSAQGNFDAAAKELDAAIASAPAQQRSALESLKKRLERKEDINK